MSSMYKIILLCLTVVIIISFFLPWVYVESQQIGALTKALTGKRQATIDSISGFDIPVIANGPDARLMLSIIKIFNPDIKDADKKSFLVWGIPILAIAIFLLGNFYGKNKWTNLSFGLLGSAIFLVAAYKIKTTDLNKMVLNVKIAMGLWSILWAYLGMGIVGLVSFIRAYIKKN
ncbi:MAG: hypothetical protein V1893_00290 [Candidatus Omnitrophota bacterium]